MQSEAVLNLSISPPVASARVAGMSKEKLIAEVDSIVGNIETQVQLGTDKDEVTAEQANVLLHTLSKLKGIKLDTVNAVSDHIGRTGVWSLTQLSAF